jgi:L-fuconolactonase
MNPVTSNRREFLGATLLAASAGLTGCLTVDSPHGRIIDTHTHFYDPTRPQGVPWPAKDDPVLYRTVLPSEYRKMAEPHGVAGTIVIEASSWLADNQWLLDLAANDPYIVGVVGHLPVGTPEFRTHLSRFRKNRLFRGIRISGETVTNALTRGPALDDLKRVQELDLSVDLLIRPEQLIDIERLVDLVPSLRIIVDHCANVPVRPPPHPPGWVSGMAACHYLPNVFMKVSGLVEGTDLAQGNAPRDVSYYREILDTIWHVFGAKRIIYGSNWPVSLRFASYDTVQRIVEDYFTPKGYDVAADYFYRNAARAYRYVVR